VIYVALVAVVASAVIALGFLSYLRTIQRAHDRRVDLLTDKMLHLAGRTWTPPPAEELEPNILMREREVELIEPEQESGY
jgi:hypothetical protein